jgi:hypothetical protein
MYIFYLNYRSLALYEIMLCLYYQILQTTSTFGTESTQSSYQKPHPIPKPTSQPQSDINQSKPSDGQSGDSTADLSQPEVHIVSRMHMSDAQRKYKENFEQKKMDEAKKQAVLEKRRQKEVRIA